MKTPHTPGPWEVKTRKLGGPLIIAKSGWICRMEIGTSAVNKMEEMMVNSDLIAAAPDMLIALKRIQRLADEMQNNTGHLPPSDFDLFGAGAQKIMQLCNIINKIEK